MGIGSNLKQMEMIYINIATTTLVSGTLPKRASLWREVRSTREVEAVCPIDPRPAPESCSLTGARYVNLDIWWDKSYGP